VYDVANDVNSVLEQGVGTKGLKAEGKERALCELYNINFASDNPATDASENLGLDFRSYS